MSLALWWGEEDEEYGGFIYFDAVTAYSQNYRGQVTKHPVDGGSNITDHFIKENPIFTVSAVITGVDLSTGTYLIQDLDGNAPSNVSPAPSAVNVTSTNDSVLRRIIPDSIGQFLNDSSPSIEVQEQTGKADLIEGVRDILINLMSGVKFNETTARFDPNIQLVKLYEFDDILLKRIINNLVMTNISFNENAESGYALFCDMTFEMVEFANLRRTTIPADVQSTLKKKASSKNSKGKVDSTTNDVSDNAGPKDVDPLRRVADEL